MPKHKHKLWPAPKKAGQTINTSFKPHSPLRRRFLAGSVIAIFLAPASWLAVHAQSSNQSLADTGASLLGQSPSAPGGPSTAGNHSSGSSTTTSNSKSSTSKQSAIKSNSNSTATSSTSIKSSSNSTSSSNAKPTTVSPSSAAAPKPSARPPSSAAAPPSAPPPPAVASTGWHDGIITTVFWIGEAADASNAHISNAESAWDGNWQSHFGGFDDPDHRNGYNPAGFTPQENPFYFALPYNDIDGNDHRKASASNCAALNGTANSVSWCKNAWIKVVKAGKTAYAQWQDVGPLQEDDAAYVFGTAKPKNTWGAKAGLDVSPAMRDYLGLQDVDNTSWSFVSAGSVPAGPWKTTVTTNPGGW